MSYNILPLPGGNIDHAVEIDFIFGQIMHHVEIEEDIKDRLDWLDDSDDWQMK